MTRFYLLRHGPTHAKSMVGWSDLPADLSDTAALTRINQHVPSDALVVSSDLSRAADTATAVQSTRQRLPNEQRLREMHFGEWELRTWAELEAETPEHIRAFWETPGSVRPPKGESWNDLCQRVNGIFDELAQAYSGANLLVVGHFGQILTQVQRADQLTAEEALAHRIDNLSVTEIRHSETDGWSLRSVNHRV